MTGRTTRKKSKSFLLVKRSARTNNLVICVCVVFRKSSVSLTSLYRPNFSEKNEVEKRRERPVEKFISLFGVVRTTVCVSCHSTVGLSNGYLGLFCYCPSSLKSRLIVDLRTVDKI